MTENQYIRATEIKKDLSVIRGMAISCKASDDLKESWKKWLHSYEEKLLKEFEEL